MARGLCVICGKSRRSVRFLKAHYYAACILLTTGIALPGQAGTASRSVVTVLRESVMDITKNGTTRSACIMVWDDRQFHMEFRSQTLPALQATLHIYESTLTSLQFQKLLNALNADSVAHLPIFPEPQYPFGIPQAFFFSCTTIIRFEGCGWLSCVGQTIRTIRTAACLHSRHDQAKMAGFGCCFATDHDMVARDYGNELAGGSSNPIQSLRSISNRVIEKQNSRSCTSKPLQHPTHNHFLVRLTGSFLYRREQILWRNSISLKFEGKTLT